VGLGRLADERTALPAGASAASFGSGTALAVGDRADHRVLERDILTVNATLVAQTQNEEMKTLTQTCNAQNEEVKKISAWAAICSPRPWSAPCTG